MVPVPIIVSDIFIKIIYLLQGAVLDNHIQHILLLFLHQYFGYNIYPVENIKGYISLDFAASCNFIFSCSTSLLYCLRRIRIVAESLAYFSLVLVSLDLRLSCSIISRCSFSHDSNSRSLQIKRIEDCLKTIGTFMSYQGSSPMFKRAIVDPFCLD